MKRTESAILAVCWLLAGGSVVYAASVSSLVSRVATLAEARGLSPHQDAAMQRAAAESVLRLYDPGGRSLSPDELARELDLMSGLATGFGWTLAVTGTGFRIQGSVSPDVGSEIPAGSVLSRIGTQDVSRISFDRLMSHVRTLGVEDSVTVAFLHPDGNEAETNGTPSRLQLPPLALNESLPEGIRWLRVNGLYPESAEKILPVIQEGFDQGDYGLILDLRGATGEDVESAARLAGFLLGGPRHLFTYRTLDDQDLASYRVPEKDAPGRPALVLINEETRGAAEAFAAAVAGAGKGVMLLGRPSRGNPLIRESTPLSETMTLYFADRKLVAADGTVYGGRNRVEPNILISSRVGSLPYEPAQPRREQTLAEEEEDRMLRQTVRYDPALRRAVDVLLGLKALRVGMDE